MVKFHALIVYFPLTRKKYLLFPTNITINFILFVAFIEYAPYFKINYCYAVLLYVTSNREECVSILCIYHNNNLFLFFALLNYVSLTHKN